MMSVVPRAVQCSWTHLYALAGASGVACTRPSSLKYVCRLSNAQMLNLSAGAQVAQTGDDRVLASSR